MLLLLVHHLLVLPCSNRHSPSTNCALSGRTRWNGFPPKQEHFYLFIKGPSKTFQEYSPEISREDGGWCGTSTTTTSHRRSSQLSEDTVQWTKSACTTARHGDPRTRRFPGKNAFLVQWRRRRRNGRLGRDSAHTLSINIYIVVHLPKVERRQRTGDSSLNMCLFPERPKIVCFVCSAIPLWLCLCSLFLCCCCQHNGQSPKL